MGRTPAGLPTLKKKKQVSDIFSSLLQKAMFLLFIFFISVSIQSSSRVAFFFFFGFFFFLTCFALGLDEPF